MSIRYRLAAVLAAIVLPLLVGVAVVLGLVLPNRLATAQAHGLDVAAQAVGSSMMYECGALGYRAQIIALNVANGQDPAAVLRDQARPNPRADTYDVVRVAGGKPVTQPGIIPADPASLPAGCSQAPGTIDRSAKGTPQLVEHATVRTQSGAITVTSVEAITPEWILAAKEQARMSSAHITIFCRTGSVSGAQADPDVVYREAHATAGQPCDIRAGESSLAGEKYRSWSTLALLVVLGLGLLLIVWLADELTSPIRALSQAARRATAGDRDVRLEMARRDEIGELGRDFDVMVAELDGLITEAERGRDALRDTSRRLGDILQRTHDLDGMLAALCALAETTGGGSCAAVWMTEGSGLRVRTVHPIGSARPEARRVAGGGQLPLQAATSRATAVSDDASSDDSSVLRGRMVALPLVSGEQVLGVLTVERPAAEPAFDADAVERLELAIGSAGIAVDNAMLHRAVQRQSVVDPLTGVGNLRHLTTSLAREIERGKRFGRPVAVMIVDIDHFKQINDELGPSVGDGVLKALADALVEHVRSVDTIARYGGEEFAVVCPELGPANAFRAGERLVDAVRAATLDVLGLEVRVTVSVGIACHPGNGDTPLSLISAADEAMGAAKSLGRDRAVVAPLT